MSPQVADATTFDQLLHADATTNGVQIVQAIKVFPDHAAMS